MNQPPVATITNPTGSDAVFQVGDTVNFEGSGSDNEDNAGDLIYQWDFDNCADPASGSSVSVTFSEPQSACTATLTVTDTGDLTGTASVDFSVIAAPENQPPVASIASPADGSQFQVGATVTFVGSGSDAETPPEALNYQWDFGSCAAPATGSSVTLTFDQVQSCTATLTVTDTGELFDEVSIDFSISQSVAGGSLERQADAQQFVELTEGLSVGASFSDENGTPVAGAPIRWTLVVQDEENLNAALFPSLGKLLDAQGNEVPLDNNGIARVEISTNGQGVSTVTFTGAGLPSSYTLTATESQSNSEVSYFITTGTAVDQSADSPEEAMLSTIDTLCPRMAGIAEDLTDEEAELLTRCGAMVGAEGAGESADVTNAARQIAPEELAAQSQIGMGIGNQQMLNITNRLTRLRGTGLASSTAGFNLNIADTRLPADMFSRALSSGGGASSDGGGLLGNGWGMFITGDVFFGDKDETNQEAGFDFETLGLTAGIDRRINDDLILGAAVGYATTDSDIDSNGGEVDVDGVTLTLYGNYYFDDSFYVDGTVGYGWNDFDTDRNINYTVGSDSVNTVASGSTDGTQFTASLGAGYDMVMENGLSVNLNARFSYLDGDIDGYDEKDENRQGLNLSYEDQSYESLTATLGGRVSRALSYEWGILIPELSFEWEHEFMDDPVTIEGNFVNDPAAGWDPVTFKFDTDDFDSNYFRLGVGASAVLGQGKQLFLRYEHLLGYDDLSQGRVSGGLRLEW